MPCQQSNQISGDTVLCWPRNVGVATLVLGTVTVNDSGITSTSRIFLTPQDSNTIGVVRVTNINAGVGFTITSTILTDSGVIAYAVH